MTKYVNYTFTQMTSCYITQKIYTKKNIFGKFIFSSNIPKQEHTEVDYVI